MPSNYLHSFLLPNLLSASTRRFSFWSTFDLQLRVWPKVRILKAWRLQKAGVYVCLHGRYKNFQGKFWSISEYKPLLVLMINFYLFQILWYRWKNINVSPVLYLATSWHSSQNASYHYWKCSWLYKAIFQKDIRLSTLFPL